MTNRVIAATGSRSIWSVERLVQGRNPP
jgi:hypothetical protein